MSVLRVLWLSPLWSSSADLPLWEKTLYCIADPAESDQIAEDAASKD